MASNENEIHMCAEIEDNHCCRVQFKKTEYNSVDFKMIQEPTRVTVDWSLMHCYCCAFASN